MTPSGIEPATCRFVAYCLNHYVTARPNKVHGGMMYLCVPLGAERNSKNFFTVDNSRYISVYVPVSSNGEMDAACTLIG